MPQRDKTVAEYRIEIAQLQKASDLPGVDAAERKIYIDTIRRIEAKIANIISTSKAASAAPPALPPEPVKSGSDQGPIPIRIIKPGSKSITPQAPAGAETTVVTANIIAATPTVTIVWDQEHSDTLTEGEVRSRFTTALRDLAESRLVKIGRIDAIQSYITFQRAVVYYRALMEFWGEPPTAQQLAIAPLKGTRAIIFEKIIQAAAETIQQIEK